MNGALGRMSSDVQSQHAEAVAARLEESNVVVRRAAVEALGGMSSEVQSQHAGVVAARLEDSKGRGRRSVNFISIPSACQRMIASTADTDTGAPSGAPKKRSLRDSVAGLFGGDPPLPAPASAVAADASTMILGELGRCTCGYHSRIGIQY